MPQSKIQSAILIDKVVAIPWGQAVKPGSTLTVPNSAGAAVVQNGTIVRDGAIDIPGYAKRDKELQYRDVAIASAISLVANRAAVVYNTSSDGSFPLSAEIELSESWSSTDTQTIAEVSKTLAAGDGDKSFSGLPYPAIPGSIQITVKTTDGTVISQSEDDGSGSILDQTDGDSTPYPYGTITGGYVNYSRAYALVYVKAHPTDSLVVTLTGTNGVVDPPISSISGADTDKSFILSKSPVVRGSFYISLDSVTTVDNLRGEIVPAWPILGGTIDYIFGVVTLRFAEESGKLSRALSFSWKTVEFVKKSNSDLDYDQNTFALGYGTGVKHVNNQSLPTDALIADKHLYRRDLVLYEVLMTADRLFTVISSEDQWAKAAADPTLMDIKYAGCWVDDFWSRAEGQSTFALPGFAARWSPATFGDPDRYLAWRDNVLARYAAELSSNLQSSLVCRSELMAIGTEDNQEISVEDTNETESIGVPDGYHFDSRPITVANGTGHQTTHDVTVESGFGFSLNLRVGDTITWYSPSDEYLGTTTITEITGVDTCKAWPLLITSSGSKITVTRDDALILPNDRSLVTEQPVWMKRYNGHLSMLDNAKRLCVRVVDGQVDRFLKQAPEETIIAAIGDYGHVSDDHPDPEPSDDVGALVHTWNPEYVICLGDNNYYDGRASEIALNNRAYTDYVDARKMLPCFGNHDFSWQSGDPGDPDVKSDSYMTNTGVSTQINFFKPPGWDTPSNLDGNNGRYYSVRISDNLEVFCLNPGWNGTLKGNALTTFKLYDSTDTSLTLEPGGWWPGCRQWEWLKNALQSSTATWKIVYLHYPPYVSNNAGSGHPGYFPARIPDLKLWGASAVMAGDAHCYERIIVDGLTYIVNGIGGEHNRNYIKPYAAGSKVRYPDSVYYGATKIIASSKSLRFETWSTMPSQDKKLLDSYTIWADSLEKTYTGRQLVKTTTDWNPTSGAVEPAIKFNDAEYVAIDGQSIAARNPRHEVESYILTEETSRFKTFKSLPELPNGRLSIVYDKLMKTARWFSANVQDVTLFEPSAERMIGIRQSQEVELLATLPFNRDSEYWRQKAAQVHCSPCREHVSEHRDLVAMSGEYGAHQVVQETAVLVQSNPIVFTKPGSALIENFEIKKLVDSTRTQWFKLDFLVNATKKVIYGGGDISPANCAGLVSATSSGVIMSAGDVSNKYQLETNIPRAGWIINLPSGPYTVSFEWINYNVLNDFVDVTIRLDGNTVYSGQWQSPYGNIGESPYFKFNAVQGTDHVLTLTVNSPTSGNGIKINRFFVLSNVVKQSEYKVAVDFYDTGIISQQSLPQISQKYSRFFSSSDLNEVISTGWIDLSNIGNRSNLSCKVSLLNYPQVPLELKQVTFKTRIKVDSIPERWKYSNFKRTCLSNAISAIKTKYARLSSPSSEFNSNLAVSKVWTKSLTEMWLDQISCEEFRLKSAFRLSTAGDVGVPALIPSGLYWDCLSGVPILSSDEAFPTLQPCQPWMIEMGFLVAAEDFLQIEEPAKPTALILHDDTGEDVVMYDPNAPKVDYSTPTGSQYVHVV